MRQDSLLRAGLAAAAALAAGGLLVPAAAQMRAAPTGGGWTAPFAPAPPAVLGGIQSLLGTPAGLKLSAELPSVQALRTYSPASDMDLRVVGAMSAHLPKDFEARLTRARTDPDALAPLARELGEAYRAAAPEVARAVESRAKQVAAAVAYGQLDGRDIVVAANELERFGVYGPNVQEKARIVRRLASQNLMENAQKVAADFLRAQRPVEGGARADDTASRKKVPEDWRLKAYQKAAGLATPDAGRTAPPAPAERKANPMSRDLYERIGAAKGMRPAELEATFRRTAELYRPERYLDRDAKSLITLTMAYRKVEEAFAVLSDPAKRADYDGGKLPQKGPPAANPLSDDFYERIGATRDMTQADVKSAYRRAAAAFHPDKSRTKDEALVKAMTKAFQDISEAYETLGDPTKRAAYDRKPAKGSPRR